MDPNAKTQLSFGFLSVRKHAVHGYFGGYLLLNSLARPLEFHCTLPVLTTKAQQILYGPTLDEFVCGEQIARALVMKAKTKPSAILTDCSAALSLRHVCDVPLACFVDSSKSTSPFLTIPQYRERPLFPFHCAAQHFHILEEYQTDHKKLISIFEKGDIQLDLVEPFGRIDEALMEAHPATKAA